MIVNGSTPEFDYPKGKNNVFARYQGAHGVPIGGTARRALFAWYFQDPNLLLSDYITAESRILFRRTVQERVATIAPFLHLDRDPYPVVSDGRIVWIQDAYTTSSYFPYAQSAPHGAFNYIRNAVKAIVDAQDGSVEFYLAAPSDPIARTYGRIFPDLFKPLSRMPADLQSDPADGPVPCLTAVWRSLRRTCARRRPATSHGTPRRAGRHRRRRPCRP